MKLLTVAIPCYNSQDYMEKCIDSLLIGGEDVEIIIVDDGSKDMTPEIADSYAKKHPEIVRAIHQENGGHGEAVNTGIRNAQGIFFKVVDSDDWVDAEAYQKILATLRELVGNGSQLDMLISNFVYEKEGAKHKKVMKYTSAIPKDLEIITVVSTVMLIRSGTEENLEKKRELWNYIKQKDLRLFHHLRNGIMGGTMNLPGKGGRKISIAAYKISQKVVGFN